MSIEAVVLALQIFVYGRVVVKFTPSIEHESVTSYEISVVRSEDNTILSTINIGKPSLNSDGEIRVRLVIRNIPLGITCHFVARAIRDTDVSSYSNPTVDWQRIKR